MVSLLCSFLLIGRCCLSCHRIAPNKYLRRKSGSGLTFSDFFPFFSLRRLPAAPFAFIKYFPEKFGNRLIFSDFFRFFFPEACILPWSLRTSIFPKKPRMVQIFLNFLEKIFSSPRLPYKYLSSNRGSRAAFFEFFSFFFPAAWVCGESKSQNEEKRHLIIENKRLTNLLMIELHGNVCTRQR